MSASGEKQKASEGSRKDWETPGAVFEGVEELLGGITFDLDAAAQAHNTKTQDFLTGPCRAPIPCGCGLCAPWQGRTVWLNPPYGTLKPWIRKCVEEARAGAHIAALLPTGTDTEWFAIAYRYARRIYFVHGRIAFVGTEDDTGSTIGSLIVEFHPDGIEQLGPQSIRLWDWYRGIVL